MTNHEIARLLRHVAASYVIKNDQKYRFQIIAYQKAADAIEGSTVEASDLFKEGKLDDLPGIGPSLSAHIEELLKTGKVRHFDAVMKDVPKAIFPLLDVPTFGPKKAFKLVSHFKLKNPETVLEDVVKLGKEGKIATLEGFGEKSQADILEAVNDFNLGQKKTVRMALPFAGELANQLISYMKTAKDVREVYPLGSLRRMKSTIGDIDLAVATKHPDKVIAHFTNYPYKQRVIEKGDISASILTTSGKQVDLLCQPPESFGSLLQHFTGSKNHNIHLREYALRKGLSLSEYGIKKTTGKPTLMKFETEEKFYKALGMQWIPPEMREDTGEIELGVKHEIPRLIELSEMKGDFHIHSNFPIEPSHDLGLDTMEVMIQKAINLGYEYLGFSEHNPSISNHSQKQIYGVIEKRNKKIDQLRMSHKNIQIFKLLETDILVNGDLAIDDRSLSILDGTIVSIHSSFSQNKDTMTKRVLSGLSHPKAKIFAHPTGRLINQRVGYELDWEKLFAFCKEHHKAIEINAWPLRLDLPDTLVREAIHAGVKLVIDTDSHAVDQMDLMRYGVAVARRGWATKHDIVNTLSYNEMKSWFEK